MNRLRDPAHVAKDGVFQISQDWQREASLTSSGLPHTKLRVKLIHGQAKAHLASSKAWQVSHIRSSQSGSVDGLKWAVPLTKRFNNVYVVSFMYCMANTESSKTSICQAISEFLSRSDLMLIQLECGA